MCFTVFCNVFLKRQRDTFVILFLLFHVYPSNIFYHISNYFLSSTSFSNPLSPHLLSSLFLIFPLEHSRSQNWWENASWYGESSRNIIKTAQIYLSVSVCLSVCSSVYVRLSVCKSVRLSMCVCISVCQLVSSLFGPKNLLYVDLG